MKCVNCQHDLPPNARFCPTCGTAQPDISVVPVPTPNLLPPEDSDGLARELAADPTLDYGAQRQFEGVAGKAFGCLGYIGIFIVGLIALIPGVPLLALVGLPAALILGLMTYFNSWHLQQRWRSSRLFNKVPGLAGKPLIQSVSVTLYLGVISAICLLIMMTTYRR
jgi:hypothetical protein